MEFTNDFIEKNFLNDECVNLYKLLVQDLFQELVDRYGVRLGEEESLEGIVTEIIEKGNYNIKTLPDFITFYIRFCQNGNIVGAVTENPNSELLTNIYGKYASAFLEENGFPDKKYRSEVAHR